MPEASRFITALDDCRLHLRSRRQSSNAAVFNLLQSLVAGSVWIEILRFVTHLDNRRMQGVLPMQHAQTHIILKQVELVSQKERTP